MNNPQEMLNGITRILELRRQEAVLLDQLRVWAEVALQGVDPNNVESLKHLRMPEGRDLTRIASLSYNVVVLKNGEIRPLDPIIKKARAV